MQPIPRQRISKHVPTATNLNTTIEYCWKWCFLIGPCKVVIRKTVGATQLVVS
jgi:hypothetical protein